MKKIAIIIDLDGTLCNTDHRQHYMTGPKKDWLSFYRGICNDSINSWCAEIYQLFSKNGFTVIFVSGRPEEYRDRTELWMSKREINPQHLFMRKSNDFRKDSVIKLEIYREHIEPYFNVSFCIDDRKQVTDMWRSIGLTCLQCAPGEF